MLMKMGFKATPVAALLLQLIFAASQAQHPVYSSSTNHEELAPQDSPAVSISPGDVDQDRAKLSPLFESLTYRYPKEKWNSVRNTDNVQLPLPWIVGYQRWLSGIPPSEAKRQQGWFATYGKRASIREELPPTTDKRQQGWFATYGKREPMLDKRQQGCHATYGKRASGQSQLLATLDKRQQGWFATYGKRMSPENLLSQIESKRQQGWFASFGKRTVPENFLSVPFPEKRQQGWYATYGKRGDLEQKHEALPQGWFSGYGKRDQYN